MREHKVILVIGFGNHYESYELNNIKGISKGSDINSANVAGFMKALTGFGSELSKRDQEGNVNSIVYGDANFSYLVKGDLTVGLISYKGDSDSEGALKKLISEEIISLISDSFNNGQNEVYINTNLFPKIREIFNRFKLF